MNVDLQDLLTRRADSVEPPTFDPWDVVAHGERLGRRRTRLVAAGAALAVAVTVGTAVLVVDGVDDEPAPTTPPDGTPAWAPGTRPLSYGQEQTLHLGDREIDTGLDFLSLDVTDDGAALTTLDGGIWFTDGTDVDRVGTTLGAGRITTSSVAWVADRPRDWVVGDSSGSLLAWLEYRDQRSDRPELVVYDSEIGSVLAREPVEVADGNSATLLVVADRTVLLAEELRGSAAPAALLRYDVNSGAFDPVDWGDVEAAQRGVDRALVVGMSAEGGAVLQSPEQVTVGEDTIETLLVRDSLLDRLLDPRTGDPVAIRVPDGYEGQHLWFTQWLDDDRFAAISNPGVNTGELFVCRIAAGRCDVAVDSSAWSIAPLTPGDGLTGSELALGRAMRATVDDGR